MSFLKYHSGSRFGLSEERQSYIYWLCRNIERLPVRQQKIIKKLIFETAEGQEEALREALCTGRTLYSVATKHYMDEATLQRKVNKFYKKAAEVL